MTWSNATKGDSLWLDYCRKEDDSWEELVGCRLEVTRVVSGPALCPRSGFFFWAQMARRLKDPCRTSEPTEGPGRDAGKQDSPILINEANTGWLILQ